MMTFHFIHEILRNSRRAFKKCDLALFNDGDTKLFFVEQNTSEFEQSAKLKRRASLTKRKLKTKKIGSQRSQHHVLILEIFTEFSQKKEKTKNKKSKSCQKAIQTSHKTLP